MSRALARRRRGKEEEFINNFNSNVVDSIYTFSILKFQICSPPPLNNI